MIVAHADWSVHPRKRWIARAQPAGDGWLIDSVSEWDPTATSTLGRLGAVSAGTSVLVGADFPIGLPAAFAAKAGLPRFPEALGVLGEGEWSEFLTLAETSGQIGLHRPFYPRAPGGTARTHLEEGLDLAYPQLLRACERATPTRRAACSVFWTLGANQVGRGAIAGWRELVRPLVAGGAALWPFDGELADLAATRAVTVAETYPAEYYAPLGLQGGPAWSKRRQADREVRGPALAAAASDLRAGLAPVVEAMMADGFGPKPEGEDAFDAVVGLLGMLRALRDGAPVPTLPEVLEHEGWILGQPLPG